ncbi:tyrosine-type recombinase/integrase [Ureibacillus aquaedulcis]|uniref:Tyrosine-type recombinase/integrase n=1 Tax=Ureibacillus aquaedulcis TaxID=3058421 RepID=A0ABT8GL59_9BACL|nr:tyrosine-type recombinase/integrase [Ureibacillus sp. BA0131]MDN4492153.1 tyrosine-type recombinase/integrase [Ureibacillus sp. BA0131]
MNPIQTLTNFEEWLRKRDKSEETICSYMASIKRFINHKQEQTNGPVLINQIKEDDVQSFVHFLQTKKQYKPASINVMLNALRTYFKFAERNQWIERNPTIHIESVKNHKKRRDYLTIEEIQQLLDVIDHPIANLIVRTLAFTGLRISECLALEIEDVDFVKNLIYVRKGKGNKPRMIPLSESLKPYLVEYIVGQRSSIEESTKLFATQKTGGFSAVYINRILKDATEQLDWKKHVTAHTLRHSFASELVRQQVELPKVAALLGHSDFRTVTSIYVHIADDELQKAVELIQL